MARGCRKLIAVGHRRGVLQDPFFRDREECLTDSLSSIITGGATTFDID